MGRISERRQRSMERRSVQCPGDDSRIPEPSIMGILPAYGIYARHVKGLRLTNINLKYMVTDERPAVVLDDVVDSHFSGLSAMTAHEFRPSSKLQTRENVSRSGIFKDTPYKTTTVTNVSVTARAARGESHGRSSVAGTPPDSLYSYPTAPSKLILTLMRLRTISILFR